MEKALCFFTDDNFLMDADCGRKISGVLRALGMEWYAFTDVSVYTKKALLEELSFSGCRRLLIGFESLSGSNLADINRSGWKQSKLSGYEEAVDVIQRHNIGVVGSFVLGMDDDTEETFDKLYDFIESTCLYGTNITVMTPFPGTKTFDALLKEGRIYSLDWSLYDGFTLVYRLANMEPDKFLEKYHELICRVNSQKRINRVAEYFKNQRKFASLIAEFLKD
jgi:Fe-S oxidoreductase